MGRYFMTGASDVDPFTVVQYIVKSEKNDILKDPISDKLYLDGSMLGIIRKYLREKYKYNKYFGKYKKYYRFNRKSKSA